MSTFLDVVNGILAVDGIIFGDDDAITSFSSTQHVASIRLAKQAVHQELAALVSDELLPYEQASAVLTVSTRLVALASDFVRFQDEMPWLMESDVGGTANGNWIAEYPGGETRLRKVDIRYRENTGKPTYWYWPGGTTKQLAFYNVPDSTYYYRYDYEKDVSVSVEADVLPFVTTTEANTFTEIAARRFKYLRSSPTLREALFPGGLAKDSVIEDGRNTLGQLLRHKPPRTTYGRRFR